MALCIACQYTKLAHQIFDVVHDECKPAIELFELPIFRERLMARRFCKITCQLPTDDAQHIEVFPIERAW